MTRSRNEKSDCSNSCVLVLGDPVLGVECIKTFLYDKSLQGRGHRHVPPQDAGQTGSRNLSVGLASSLGQ